MSKKKKIDLSADLADLIMGDETENTTASPAQKTRVLKSGKDADLDPTLQLGKTSNQTVPSKGIGRGEISLDKNVPDYEIQRFDKTEKKQEPTAFGATNSVPAELQNSRLEDERSPDVPKRFPREEVSIGNTDDLKVISEKFPAHPVSVSDNFQYASPIRESRRSGPDVVLSAEASLAQSEKLRIAQERILDLERVVETLRAENEQLMAAGETFRNNSDDLRAQLDQLKLAHKERLEAANEEMIVLRSSTSSKSEEIVRQRHKIEELESRLSGDLKKIRVRERELENRLEIARLEHNALLKNKDEIILDLKRKIDQLGFELENYRSKGKELNKSMEDTRERVRRTVKALRLALSMLEGEDEDSIPLKKAE